MEKRSSFIFIVLHVFAWIIFVGLSIEACGLIVNFIFSLVRPDKLGLLYQKLDLISLKQQSNWMFYCIYTLAITIAVSKAALFYTVIQLIMKLDMSKPFDTFTTKKISQISYQTFGIGLISLIARQTVKNLIGKGYDLSNLNQFWVDGQAFILMAGIIYLIAQIFRRGVELQYENELTV